LKPTGAAKLSTLEGNSPSIIGTIQSAEAETKNTSQWYIGKIILQEHLQAAAKNCVGADSVGIVHIIRHSLCPQYAV